MTKLLEWIEPIRSFAELGGGVLLIIAGLTLVMWVFIIERAWFLRLTLRSRIRSTVSHWSQRQDKRSWWAHQVREAQVSRIELQARQFMPLIKALILVCPLLGLLGTVSGMIEVFEAMALSGNGNARAMAAGVSKATIPTMASMVTALSGMMAMLWLERGAKLETARLKEQLVVG